jgi:uncharacterized membrane-anchored protein
VLPGVIALWITEAVPIGAITCLLSGFVSNTAMVAMSSTMALTNSYVYGELRNWFIRFDGGVARSQLVAL